MVVPHVEIGHKGQIPIAMIEEVICLSLIEDPDDLTLALTGHFTDTPDGRIIRRMPIQLSGLYKDSEARDYVILQEDIERTARHGFVVHVRVTRQHDEDWP